MALVAYLDDSGTHGGSAAVVVAGYIASPQAWTRFAADWALALSDFGVSSFHMTDFAARKQHFASWDDSRRADLSRRLDGIIERHLEASVGAAIPTAAYERVAAPILRHRQGGPYGMAFWACVLAVKEMMDLGELRMQDVAYVVERGTAGAGDIQRVFAHTQAFDPGAARTKAVSLSFVAKSEVLAFQAADILAWQLFREIPRQLGLTDARQRSRDLDRLLVLPHRWGYFTDAEIAKWAGTMSRWPVVAMKSRRPRRPGQPAG